MKPILKLLFSYKFTVIALSVYAVIMGVATFVEVEKGTPFVREYFYGSWWFIAIHILLIVNFIGISLKTSMWERRRYGAIVLHWGFVVVLMGAMVTHLVSQEGILHVREGSSSNKLLTVKGETIEELPFSVELKDFVLERYPGSGSPSAYSSHVVIYHNGEVRKEHIYMNNIAYVGRYRLYQASYDTDEKGTVLSINRDLEGTIISYFGYLLLAIGFVWSLFAKGSYFRQLSARLKDLSASKVVLFIIFMTATTTLNAQDVQDVVQQVQGTSDIQNTQQQTLKPVSKDVLIRTMPPKEVADSMARVLILNPSGRVEPFSSYASKIVRKIYRSSSLEGHSPEQILIAMLSSPTVWDRAPIIYVKDENLRKQLGGGDDKYLALMNFFTPRGEYKLQGLVDSAYNKPQGEQTPYDKEILKADEKVNIFSAILEGRMMSMFPLPGSVGDRWYSAGDDLSEFRGMDSVLVSRVVPWFLAESMKSFETGDWNEPIKIIDYIKIYQRKMASDEHLIAPEKIEAEILYNRLNIFSSTGIAYASLGFLLLVMVFVQLLKSDTRSIRLIIKILVGLIIAVFLFHGFGIGLRWYISGRAPWTNAYESMVYVSWSAALAGLLFVRRSSLATAIAIIMAGIIVLISQLNWLDPEITPLVPVLKSYWLMFHVAIITASYGFFGMSALLGIVLMLVISFSHGGRINARLEELAIINKMSQMIGLALLTVGIFLGAVWANESWGRYWGWDPKETWALITMVLYVISTHAHFIPKLRGTYATALMSVVMFYGVLMTFFGVNYYLSGMHSYGGGGSSLGSGIFLGVTGAVVLLALVAFLKQPRSLKK